MREKNIRLSAVRLTAITKNQTRNSKKTDNHIFEQLKQIKLCPETAESITCILNTVFERPRASHLCISASCILKSRLSLIFEIP
jgi:hypothetical protein